MATNTNLITTYNFRGREFLVNVNTGRQSVGNIEIKVTDKKTLEEWMGSYDVSYVENLTYKTGNYKRFDTFVSMIKSGLLSTSHCVTLDLLTFEDLEMLRNKMANTKSTPMSFNPKNSQSCNRRYLIITYTVEFDRIHYPLALEYCGPPDPKILQETILRLEKQVTDLSNQVIAGNNMEDITNQIDSLQRKIVDVTTENITLKDQLKRVNEVKKLRPIQSQKEMDLLLKSIYSLENKLKIESSNVQRLQQENFRLAAQLEEAMKNEKMLRAQLNVLHFNTTKKTSFPQRHPHNIGSPSPTRNRSLDISLEKPFQRRNIAARKVHSARNSFEIGFPRSSSEGSLIGSGDRGRSRKMNFQSSKQSPRPRHFSPTFSDLSHNSGISRCGCRNCLQAKFAKKDDLFDGMKRKRNVKGKAQLLQRIQSLENLISGIIIN